MNEFKRRFNELIRISAPIILEQIFITVMGLVNQMMSANAIGEHAVSAVGIIDGVSNIMIALFAALTTGGTIVVAQHAGRRDMPGAKKAGAQAMTLAVIMSALILLFFGIFRVNIVEFLFDGSEERVLTAGLKYFTVIIFSYPMLAIMQTVFGVIRGTGDTATPMAITIVMNVINVVIGYLLIFPWSINIFVVISLESPGFGVYGAALALTTARLVGMVLSLIHVFFHSKTIRFNKLSDFKPDMAVQKSILGLGVPTSIESSMFQIGRLITQLYIVGMGTAAMFANSISSTIFGFVNVPGNAFGTGVMILIGQKVGRGEYDDIKKSTMFAVATGTVMFTIISVILYPMAPFIAKIYNAGPESTPLLIDILHAGLIATPLFWAASFTTPAGLRATGDVKFTMVVAIFSMWAIRIALGYILGVSMGIGVLGVWFAMFADWIFRAIVFQARLWSGKWMKKLPKGE